MIGRVLLAALLAGIAAGLAMSALQAWKVTPLIIAAEAVFEGEAEPGDANTDVAHAHDPNSAWMPHNGFERTTATIASNIIAGVAFALVLTGVVIFTGFDLSIASGAMLGLLGFCTFSLAPGLGLPPNLPGVPAAELMDRQTWWWVTVIATGLGIWMIARLDTWVLKALGGVVILLPHIIGAPQPEDADTEIPARLAAEFATNSLVIAAVFWVVLGALLGWLMSRQKLNEEAD